MKKLFLVAFLSVLFVCCSCSTIQQVGCSVESSVTSVLASTVASSMSCVNLSVIQSDMQSAMGKANLCSVNSNANQLKAHLKGPVGDVVCPIAVQAALGLVGTKVPQAWGCSPSASTSGLATLLTSACIKVVPL